MELPPGPRYVLRLIPTFALPSLAVYLALTVLQLQGFCNLSLWFIVPAVLLAKPILFFWDIHYSKWATRRAAASFGAVVPPVVQEWSIFTIKEIAGTTRTGHPCNKMLEFEAKYGHVFQLELLSNIVIATTEPEHVKTVLATQFDTFEKGPLFIDQMSSLLGTGVFNADGEMWKFHRAMTRPFFTRERISDFEIYHRNCDVTLRVAKQRLNEGLSVDFQDLVSRFTLDSATEFLFGNNVGSLLAGIPYPPSHESKTLRSFYDHPSTAFVKAFVQGQVQSAVRLNFSAEWPLSEFWADEVKPSRNVMDQFIEPLMERALERRQQEIDGLVESKTEEETLLGHLVKHTQDTAILKDELANLLVAGRDTTGSLLTFSMYMLTQHPDIEKRLRAEIFDTVGPAGSPTYEHMCQMKYVRAFLNEVLRLYPPVPADFRCSNKATILPPAQSGQKPVYVPVNTPILYVTMNMQRRTDLWGPDALEFDPDRFLDNRLHKYLIPNPFIFSPFNAGPRICLGQQFAYHEATFFLVRLLQNFTGFSLDDSVNLPPPADWASGIGRKATEKIFPLSHLTLYVNGGLWVHMKELPGA